MIFGQIRPQWSKSNNSWSKSNNSWKNACANSRTLMTTEALRKDLSTSSTFSKKKIEILTMRLVSKTWESLPVTRLLHWHTWKHPCKLWNSFRGKRMPRNIARKSMCLRINTPQNSQQNIKSFLFNWVGNFDAKICYGLMVSSCWWPRSQPAKASCGQMTRLPTRRHGLAWSSSL